MFVAEQLAKFAKISARAVSYAGLKDRHAVTEQWFCLQMPGKEHLFFSTWQLEAASTGCHWQKRKLRIGSAKGNQFRKLCDISDAKDVEQRLQKVALSGVLITSVNNVWARWAKIYASVALGKPKINVRERNKRSFYLSAARSAMFNHVASERIANNTAQHVMLGDARYINRQRKLVCRDTR